MGRGGPRRAERKTLFLHARLRPTLAPRLAPTPLPLPPQAVREELVECDFLEEDWQRYEELEVDQVRGGGWVGGG